MSFIPFFNPDTGKLEAFQPAGTASWIWKHQEEFTAAVEWCQANGVDVTDRPDPSIRRLIDAAHNRCLKYIENSFADAAGMLKLHRIAIANPDNATYQQAIVDCEVWADSIWAHYKSFKDSVLAAAPIELKPEQFGEPPYGFFELLAMVA